jgi:uncharacterized lipoprotein NlpE involved in copper resistance
VPPKAEVYMKKIFFIPALVFFALGLNSCLQKKTAEAANAVNFSVYSGLVPAASGSGIEVEITLTDDFAYIVEYKYRDKSDERFVQSGTYTKDAGKGLITLEIENFPPYYQIGEGTLTQLDMAGNKITGNLADNYVLKKIQ